MPQNSKLRLQNSKIRLLSKFFLFILDPARIYFLFLSRGFNLNQIFIEIFDFFQIFVAFIFGSCANAQSQPYVNASSLLRPTFVVNFDLGIIICQHSPQAVDLHLHPISALCDGVPDCYESPAVNDETFPYCSESLFIFNDETFPYCSESHSFNF